MTGEEGKHQSSVRHGYDVRIAGFNVDEGIDWQSYGDWNWFGFIADHEMDYVVDEDGFVWCKQEEIENALEEHLDIDAAELRTQTNYYDAQKKMYRIPEGWDPGLIWYDLLDSWQGDNLLYIESALYDATRGDATPGSSLWKRKFSKLIRSRNSSSAVL